MIQGRIIMLSPAAYMAATYALHASWDETAQWLNHQHEHYEVPLENALFDAKIVERAARTPEKQRSAQQIYSLGVLNEAAEDHR